MKARLAVFLLIVGYVVLTLPGFFTTHHILYNLEPYPDGLLYIQPAINFASGRSFALLHEGHHLIAWVPPLYSLLLVPLYVLFHLPQVFYLTNIFLGIASHLFLFFAIQENTKNRWLSFLGCIFFLLHGYIVWLPSIPMAENALLFFMTLGLWILSQKKLTILQCMLGSIVVLGLVFTKYSLIFIAAVIALALLLVLLKQKSRKLILFFLFTLALGGSLFLWYEFSWAGFNPMSVIHPIFQAKSQQSLLFFSPTYFFKNAIFYGKAVMGLSTTFLWLSFPLTAWWASLILAGATSLAIRHRRHRRMMILCMLLFAAQLGMNLFFYVADARYIILFIPLVCLSTCLFIDNFQRLLGQKKAFILTVTLILLHVFNQYHFYTYLMSLNILHHTRAWQYEAIQNLNMTLQHDQDTYLITALPPYLVDMYQVGSWHVLPLSSTQEFMNTPQQVWGTLDYTHLAQSYRSLLMQGKHIFLTNAYLSSQSEFSEKYKELSSQFVITPISQGCLGTCTIVQLSLDRK